MAGRSALGEVDDLQEEEEINYQEEYFHLVLSFWATRRKGGAKQLPGVLAEVAEAVYFEQERPP